LVFEGTECCGTREAGGCTACWVFVVSDGTDGGMYEREGMCGFTIRETTAWKKRGKETKNEGGGDVKENMG